MTKQPWNKNKSVGQKKPFTPRQVEMLKDILTNKNDFKELALVHLSASGLFPLSYILSITVADVKSWHLIGKLDEACWKDIQALILLEKKKDEDFLFEAYNKNHMAKQTYAFLVKKWCGYLELDPKDYGTSAVIKSLVL